MVGHTGVIPAAVAAIEAVDACLGDVVTAVHETGGACIVTADHGNADNMLEPDGSPNTAHSTNPVPLIVTAGGVELEAGGILADVAPTALRLLGIEQPAGMTGRSLVALADAVGPGAPAVRDRGPRRGRQGRAPRHRARRGLDARRSSRSPRPARCAGSTPTRSAALGYEMVLGNTFHLFLRPGPERIAELGGLHAFMGWDRAIITDSGGFQVFSLAHGNVADEIKGRRGRRRHHGAIIEIAEEGVRFRSYLDGVEQFMGPEESMQVQAALGSDIALAFDECTPYHADYDYTARSTERTHRWLDRCTRWHEANAPGEQALFGIVQGGVHEELRRASAERVASADDRRHLDRRHAGPRQGRDARRPRADGAAAAPRRRPSTCSASASPTTCSTGSRSASTSSTARSRPGSGATGRRWRRCPTSASGSTSARARSSATRGRWWPAARAPPAPGTRAPTSTTWPAPRS